MENARLAFSPSTNALVNKTCLDIIESVNAGSSHILDDCDFSTQAHSPNELVSETRVPCKTNEPQTSTITQPKVGILNFCSGFRWTAVLESVQRNPLTNAVTLQSIPLFRRFLCSEFRCNALDSTIKYLKHSDL